LCWAHWFRYRCWTRIHAYTEQIDAMEVSGTNPFKYLVVTRIMATTLMLPILVFWCYCSFGSYLVENIKGHVSFTVFQSGV
jgi:phospholipid/cholesterol/gamma-HCH transport system permease protein